MRRVIKDQSVMRAVAIHEAGKREIGLAFGVHRRSGAALGATRTRHCARTDAGCA
jgi:hypothetical protein